MTRLDQDIIKVAIGVVVDEFGVTEEGLLQESRGMYPLPQARHYLMWLVRSHTGLSNMQLGELFGRHHASVLYGIKNVDDEIRIYKDQKIMATRLTAKVEQSRRHIVAAELRRVLAELEAEE